MLRIQTLLIVLLACGLPALSQTPPPAPPQTPAPVDPATEPAAVFRTGVADVRIVVQVTEGKEILKGLKKEDFVVTDQRKPQTIGSFSQDKDPLDLLLLLDISGSMREHVTQMSDTAREALKSLLPGDRVAVMTFGVRTNVHFGWFDNHAEVSQQLRTAPEDQEKVGYGTAINSAIIDATRYMSSDDSPGRHSILIVTDNLGLNHNANDQMAVGYLLKADAVLNAIVVGRGIRPGAPKPGDNPDFTPADVFKLAEQTGGEAVTVEHAAASFPDMVARIRDRYTLTYHVPSDAHPGQFRELSVSLSPDARKLHPKAEVRARSGYYVRE